MPLTNQTLSLARRIGAAVIAVAAVIIWVSMGSSEKSDAQYLDDIQSAMASDRANQSGANYSAQQTVVNGWTARDLLAISDRIQAAGSRDDDRIGAELALLCLAVAWYALTSPRYPAESAQVTPVSPAAHPGTAVGGTGTSAANGAPTMASPGLRGPDLGDAQQSQP